jgi:hypothetical protein
MEEYDYGYGYNATLPTGVIIAICAVALFMIICQWRIYTKAGQPGWAAIIPIYNIYVMTKIVGKPGYWTLLCLIPILNIIFGIWMLNMLSKSFGKDVGFTLGLLFLGIIFYPILAFGPAKYQGPFGDPAKFAEYQGKNKFDFENK